MNSRILLFLFVLCLLALTTVFAQNPSVCVVTSQPQQAQTGGWMVTATGTVNALFIFVDFADDTFDVNNPHWPIDPDTGIGPDFMCSIVDSTVSQSSGTYANVSTFFNDQSRGQFKMTGKGYYVRAPHALSYYAANYSGSEAAYSAQDAIQLLDQRGVDFLEFDNWIDSPYSHSQGSDQVLDMVFICYRIWYLNRGNYGSSFMAEGWYGASLPSDVWVDNGTRRVVSSHAVDVCSMVQYPRFEHLIHEFGHVWGLVHQYAPGLWTLMGQRQPSVGSSMNSLEQVQLGWTTFTTPVDSHPPYDLPDFCSTGVAYRIVVPNTNPQEYYLIENHQGSSVYDVPDLTGAKGIYILQNAANVEPAEATLRVVPSDGRWNWTISYWIPNPWAQNPPPAEIIPVFQRGAMNPISGLSDHDLFWAYHAPPCNHNGYNMMFAWLDEETGGEMHGTRFKGDGRDRWNLTDNNLFSPWSNPAASSSGGVQAEIALQVTAENQGIVSVEFYLSNPTAAPPSKPQGVIASWNSSGQILVSWTPNQEPDMLSGGTYDVYRAVYYSGGSLSYTKMNSTPLTTPTYTDSPTIPSGLPAGVDVYFRYQVKAKDSQGNYSVPSEDSWVFAGRTISGSVSANTTWNGRYIAVGNITVNSNVILTVSATSRVMMYPGTSLTVNGTLNANGTSSQPITFTSSSGTWSGIVINSGGIANIQYCDISSAVIGIDLEGSALASIEHCNFSGDTDYGIKAANATATTWAIIRDNTIPCSIPIYCYYGQVLAGANTLSGCQGVFAYGGSATVHSNLIDSYIEGIFALNYSTVSLLGATDGRGHNRILPTDATLYAEYNSSIDAGEPAGGTPGYNSFYGGCIDAQMVAVDDGHILAQYNWWNDDFSSITFNGGTADNSNPLDYDPNGGMGKVVAQAAAKTVTSGPATDPFFDADLVAALNSIQQGKYDNARELLGKKFAGAISVGMKKYILAQLGECYRRAGRTDFPEFLNSDVRPNLSKTDDLYVASLELESKWYIQSGLYARARGLLEGMRSEYSERENTYKHVLFNLGNLCYSQLNEVDAAGEYLEELKAKYPNDMLTWHARLLLGERDIALPKPGPGKTQTGDEVPKSFAFSQNYPNPFNPSTTLKYGLPAAGEVSLVVYDVLGREVAILTRGNHEAGYYSATWNATTAASGIYFAQLTVINELGSVIFNKVNKLLLVK